MRRPTLRISRQDSVVIVHDAIAEQQIAEAAVAMTGRDWTGGHACMP